MITSESHRQYHFLYEKLSRPALLVTYVTWVLLYAFLVGIAAVVPSPRKTIGTPRELAAIASRGPGSGPVNTSLTTNAQIAEFWRYPFAREPVTLTIVTPGDLSGFHQDISLELVVNRLRSSSSCAEGQFCPGFDFALRRLWLHIKLEAWQNGKWKVLRTDERPVEKNLVCNSGTQCAPILLHHISNIQYSRYRLSVRPPRKAPGSEYDKVRPPPSDLSEGQRVDISELFETLREYTTSIHGRVQFINPRFTTFEVAFRGSFALTAFVLIFVYYISLRKIPPRAWVAEQKWVMFLLLLLLGLNNPIFYLSVSYPAWPLLFMNMILLSSFLIGFLLFLLVFSDLLLKEAKRPSLTFRNFYFPKLILGLTIWMLGVCNYAYTFILGSLNADNLLDENMSKGWIIFRIVKVGCFIVYGVWLCYIVLRILGKWWKNTTQAAQVPRRTKFFWFWMLAMVFPLGAGLFKLHNLGTIGELNSLEFVSFFAAYNLATYLVTWMYSPPYFGGLPPNHSKVTRAVTKPSLVTAAADLQMDDANDMFEDDDIY